MCEKANEEVEKIKYDPNFRECYYLAIAIRESLTLVRMGIPSYIWALTWFAVLVELSKNRLGAIGILIAIVAAVTLFTTSGALAARWRKELEAGPDRISPMVGSSLICVVVIFMAGVAYDESKIISQIESSIQLDALNIHGLVLKICSLMAVISSGYLFKCPWDRAVSLYEIYSLRSRIARAFKSRGIFCDPKWIIDEKKISEGIMDRP